MFKGKIKKYYFLIRVFKQSKNKLILAVFGGDKNQSHLFGSLGDIGRINKSAINRSEKLSSHFIETCRVISPGARSPYNKLRLFLLGGVLVTLICYAGIELFALQISLGSNYYLVAESNRVIHQTVLPLRGVIKDRNGITLASNEPNFQLVIAPNQLPIEPQVQTELIIRLAKLTGLDFAEMTDKIIANKSDKEILIANQLPYEVALILMVNPADWLGIRVETVQRRAYLTANNNSLSHVLGFTGTIPPDVYSEYYKLGYRKFDLVGKTGIELWYESELRGEPGMKQMEVNSAGIIQRVLQEREPISGKDIMLTIDMELQRMIDEKISEVLEPTNLRRASVVALDPNNGEVLALVSTPAFDANIFSSGVEQDEYVKLLNDPDKPFFNRAVAGEFPSGSTIKPIFAAAALTNGMITPSKTFLSNGGLQLGDRFFPDWKGGGHGLTNVYKAIAESVNTFFYQIGGGSDEFEGMGVEKLMTAALSFGLGQLTLIDLPGEKSGFLPSKQWKEETKGESWYVGDTYNVSIGQGDILVTPLQMAVVAAAFANQGLLIQPHLLTDAVVPINEPLISSEVLTVIQDGMKQAVTSGTARMLLGLPQLAAAKTGTAQWSNLAPPHSWFIGYYPADNPTVALAVMVEEGGVENLATKIAKEIFLKIEKR